MERGFVFWQSTAINFFQFQRGDVKGLARFNFTDQTQNALGFLIDIGNSVRAIQNDNRRAAGIHHFQQKGAASEDIVLKLLLFTDVQMHARNSQRCTVSRALGHPAARQNPDPMAINVAHAEFSAHDLVVRGAIEIVSVQYLGLVFWVQHGDKISHAGNANLVRFKANNFAPTSAHTNSVADYVKLPSANRRPVDDAA